MVLSAGSVPRQLQQREGLVPNADEFATIPEIVEAARRKLSRDLWDYAIGGAETEVTLRRNRSAFESIAFRPRVLRDVSTIDTTCTILGQELALPVMLAPVGSLHLYHPDSACAVARSAHHVGTAAIVGALSAPQPAEVKAASDGPLIFQAYTTPGRDWIKKAVGEAEAAGYLGFCLTVDSSIYGRRERDLHNRFSPRRRSEAPPPIRNVQASITWEYVDWLRSITKLPLILKGIQTAEDARMAVERGIEVVYVSNHGGRQLDQVSATIEILPEVVEAVAGRATVLVDGGFVRGTDVMKGLALGADAVVVGKLTLLGLAAGGEEGLSRTLEILHTEMQVAMANLGVSSISELDGSFLRSSSPPSASPWPIA